MIYSLIKNFQFQFYATKGHPRNNARVIAKFQIRDFQRVIIEVKATKSYKSGTTK
jgi:hypothetical protein